MEMTQKLHVSNREDWRSWLEKNHGSKKEIWLVHTKKHTGKPRIPYDDAVEEALCFGWIDSIVKKIDADRYAQKFTPRKEKSKWSALNKKRIIKLIKQGKMTKAGMVKVKDLDLKEIPPKSKPANKNIGIPPDIEKALKADQNAWDNFNELAPSYKKQYIGWISNAKKSATRKGRLGEAVETLALNKKLGMK